MPHERQYAEAKRLFSNGQSEESLKLIRSGFARARSSQRYKDASDLCILAHYIQWSQGGTVESLRWAGRALDTARQGHDHERELRTLLSSSATLTDIGAHAHLEHALGQAFELCGRSCPQRGWLELNRGNLEFQRGNWRLAIRSFERAAEGLGEAAFPARANSITAMLQLWELEQSPHLLQDALRGFLALEKEHYASELNEATRKNRGAELELLRLRLAWAQRDPSFANPQTSRGSDLDRRWETECIRGQFSELAGNSNEAERRYKRAIAEITAKEQPGDSLHLSQWQIEARRVPFERLLSLLVAQGRILEAYYLSEEIKTKRFVGEPFAWPAKPQPPSQTVPARAADELEKLHLADQQRRARVRHACSIQRGQDYLSFIKADDRYHRFWLSPARGLSWKDLGSSRAVESEVNQLLSRLEHSSFGQHAASLGRRLLPTQLARSSESFESLVLSPDAKLGKVPWAALILDDRYLVEQRVPRLAPSTQILAPDLAPRHAMTVLADSLGDLPAATISAWSMPAEYKVLGGSTKRGVLRGSRFSEILHLAIHNTSTPGSELHWADGPMDVDAIQAWTSAPRLSVLAGCGTANSMLPNIWSSWIGAFMRAGSECAVGSLWSLEDRSTASFFRAFYRTMRELPPAQALAQTQRSFAHRPGSSLSHWAGFVIGSYYETSSRSFQMDATHDGDANVRLSR